MFNNLLEKTVEMQTAFTEVQTKWRAAFKSELYAEEGLYCAMLEYLRGEPSAMTSDELKEVLNTALKNIEIKRTLL